MAGTFQLPVEIINKSTQLDVAVREMAGSTALAIDTESNSFHRYPEQLCLIQVATRAKIYIIDTIYLKDVSSLEKVLENNSIIKVIHGADYDIRCLDRHCGFRIRRLYDTNVAARFAGISQVSLAALLKDLMGITIGKSKRLQLADWGRRPLSDEAVDYAAGDVRYLHALQAILDLRLTELGRAAWVAEECARMEEMRYNTPDLEKAYLSVKGAENLDMRGLMVLKSIFLFRDKEARIQHKPLFFVLADASLISIAANPAVIPTDIQGLQSVAGSQRFKQGLQQAVSEGLIAPLIEIEPPIQTDRLSPAQMTRLNSLKLWRSSLAAMLSMDPSLLWPKISLERLAKAPDNFNVELASVGIRNWQRDHIAPSLLNHLKSNG